MKARKRFSEPRENRLAVFVGFAVLILQTGLLLGARHHPASAAVISISYLGTSTTLIWASLYHAVKGL